MRALFFIGMLLAMGYVAYLQMSQVKEHDLDKAETKIDQTREQLNKTLEEQQRKIDQMSTR